MPPTPEEMRRALRRATGAGAAGIVLLALLALALARTGPGEAALADLRGRVRPLALLPALALMTSAFVFMALRWRALMPGGTRAGIAGLTAIQAAGLLLNFAVPGPFGELAAAWFAGRRYRVSTADALAAGIAARVTGLATAAALAAATGLAFRLRTPPEAEGLVAAAAAVVGGGGLLVAAVAARPAWWAQLSAATLGRWTGRSAPARAARRLHGVVEEVTGALARVLRRGGRPYARAVGWSLCGHLAVVGGIALACHAVGARPEPAGLVFTYAASTAGTVALFALPGSQVGWDALFLGLLVATAGLGVADAAVVVGLVRVQQLLVMVVGAAATAALLARGGDGEARTQ